MKLTAPFVQLPLLFDVDALAAEIDALPETCWKPHPQGFPGNSMVPLVAVDGDPNNVSFAGRMRPTPELSRCPYLMQVMDSLGATIGRTRLMRLSGLAEVKLHADQGYYWAERVRVHVPIVTWPEVRFVCGDAEVNMAAGECWIFDTWRRHRVLNGDSRSRVHLVVDTVGGGQFWDRVNQGRAHAGPPLAAPWRVAPNAAATPQLHFETFNVPVVMSPWEMRAHFAFLFGEAQPHPQLATLKQLARSLCNRWQELWARFADSDSEGRPLYRQLLADCIKPFQTLGATIVLKNNLSLGSVFMTLIGQFGVIAEEFAPRSVGMDTASRTDIADLA